MAAAAGVGPAGAAAAAAKAAVAKGNPRHRMAGRGNPLRQARASLHRRDPTDRVSRRRLKTNKANHRRSSQAQAASRRRKANSHPQGRETRRHLRASNHRLNNRARGASLRLRQANRRRGNFVRSLPSRGRASRRVGPRRPQDPTARPRVNPRTRLTPRPRQAK